MVKKMKIKIIAMLLVCGAANAGNEYTCTNHLTMTTKVQGYKTQHSKLTTSTKIAFWANNVATGTGTDGFMSYGTFSFPTGNTILITTDTASIEQETHNTCAKYHAVTCQFLEGSNIARATISHNSTVLKGVAHFEWSAIVDGLVQSGVSVNHFTCQMDN
jgi:hypothetical protein